MINQEDNGPTEEQIEDMEVERLIEATEGPQDDNGPSESEIEDMELKRHIEAAEDLGSNALAVEDLIGASEGAVVMGITGPSASGRSKRLSTLIG